MTRKVTGFRLRIETVGWLDKLQEWKGKDRTWLVEEAIDLYYRLEAVKHYPSNATENPAIRPEPPILTPEELFSEANLQEKPTGIVGNKVDRLQGGRTTEKTKFKHSAEAGAR